MRQSPKAWIWNTIQSHTAGSMAEATAAAKEADDPRELQGLQRMRRSLLPRT
ncbi:hypothetical protein HQN87_04985 [Paenibacillus tritici]|uniref:Uncharacterized protein n=1 Tax=Paenibacillus tritici TaxID=1873425 RepID=A0ABX2DJ88_9BACL|nr:hypothetical protein [Paenibacillus tritici]NQX44679.1 hypothetical protein [Paenibacillus tritici]QUL53725.1 hypothetical protein KDC22_25725 [Paenibacillus tritici]